MDRINIQYILKSVYEQNRNRIIENMMYAIDVFEDDDAIDEDDRKYMCKEDREWLVSKLLHYYDMGLLEITHTNDKDLRIEYYQSCLGV